ncbi:MAG: stage II sporulation protein M [Dehalococcoidia bacterium]|nr:MAG: stage II sporulation protein M [Dehalococcoidia bacterium]
MANDKILQIVDKTEHRLPARALFSYAAVFVFVFTVFLYAGYSFHREALAALSPSVNTAISMVEAVDRAGGNLPLILAGAIFAKNIVVALLVLAFGRRLFGLFPAFVLAVNAAVIGAVYGDLTASGAPWQEAVSYFAPHGVIEIPALIGACVLAVCLKGAGLKERLLRGMTYVAGPLAVAALVEVYVTPAALFAAKVLYRGS